MIDALEKRLIEALKTVDAQGACGNVAEPCVVRSGRLRRRAHPGGQRRCVRQMGLDAARVRRRQAARHVNRAVRNEVAESPAVHEPYRRDRALRSGRPWRPRNGARRGADRRADGRFDPLRRSARIRCERVQGHARIFSSSTPLPIGSLRGGAAEFSALTPAGPPPRPTPLSRPPPRPAQSPPRPASTPTGGGGRLRRPARR